MSLGRTVLECGDLSPLWHTSICRGVFFYITQKKDSVGIIMAVHPLQQANFATPVLDLFVSNFVKTASEHNIYFDIYFGWEQVSAEERLVRYIISWIPFSHYFIDSTVDKCNRASLMHIRRAFHQCNALSKKYSYFQSVLTNGRDRPFLAPNRGNDYTRAIFINALREFQHEYDRVIGSSHRLRFLDASLANRNIQFLHMKQAAAEVRSDYEKLGAAYEEALSQEKENEAEFSRLQQFNEKLAKNNRKALRMLHSKKRKGAKTASWMGRIRLENSNKVMQRANRRLSYRPILTAAQTVSEIDLKARDVKEHSAAASATDNDGLP